jgi:alanine-synthesizing transaminase
MFSRRARWDAPVNQLTIARQSRAELLDLTESNPTRAAIDYPLDELSEIFARAARAPYSPEPLGLRSAREAVAESIGAHPDDIVITASTSEAYSYLFKLLTDPGDAVATATPTYPLLEHLASMESVELRPFALELHRRWELHADALQRGISRETRAIVVVNPNNPTGSFVTPDEQRLVASQTLPVISDEVFLDYPLDGSGTTFTDDCTLHFALGGLSKSAGLPHYKLGWIRVGGPAGRRQNAIEKLELIADNFLSVATPVQVALPELLRIAPRIRKAISRRTRENLAALQRVIAGRSELQLLPVEGGWSAVIRVPQTRSDEELALDFLDRGVIVHPGYFFDFPRDGWFVVSLLTPPDIFREGLRRIL